MRLRVLLALGILALYSVASYIILHSAISKRESIGRAVTVAGQQRMFSQRIALFSEQLAAASNEAVRRAALADLNKSVKIFESAHAALSRGDRTVNPPGWPPPQVRSMYFGPPYLVDERVHDYVARASEIARRGAVRGKDDPDLEYIMSQGPGPLLAALDAVVQEYNRESRASIARFEALQAGLLVASLLTLLLVWLYIFRPLEREVLAQAAAMERDATYDHLTGLLNRKGFRERVEEALAVAVRHSRACSLLWIDLDGFKAVNDRFGHLAGDATLRVVAERLRSTTRDGEIVARIGGDEFAIFVPEVQERRQLEVLAQRLAGEFVAPIPVGAQSATIGASIGIASFTGQKTLDELLAAADEAMYQAKAQGGGAHKFYAAAE